MKNILAISVLGLATGCATADSVFNKFPSEEVKALKSEVETLKSKPAFDQQQPLPKQPGAASEEDEAAARTFSPTPAISSKKGNTTKLKPNLLK